VARGTDTGDLAQLARITAAAISLDPFGRCRPTGGRNPRPVVDALVEPDGEVDLSEPDPNTAELLVLEDPLPRARDGRAGDRGGLGRRVGSVR
jgi:hypothetical protein